jgi:lipopolysaccharide transport system permease protein
LESTVAAAGKVPFNNEEEWTEIIEPKTSLFDLKLREVWRYRDLLMLMVKRDFIATYKQTILGPVWFFLQPVFTTLTFTIIFGRVAGLSTNGLPMLLFYIAGITLWNYFAECLNRTATVFKDNAQIFGKVYFPRLVLPLSIIISNLVKLGIQFLIFLGFWAFYLLTTSKVHPNVYILLMPVLVAIMGGLGLGLGMIISALTTKYRDLIFLLTFGVQLLMYATPVIYSLADPKIAGSSFAWLLHLNPMAPIVETFRYGFLGKGYFSWTFLGYSFIFMVVSLLAGTIIFNKVEKTFMDTV